MKSQIDRVEWWLKKHNIPFKRIIEDNYVKNLNINRNQILIETEHDTFSIICQYGSYGYEKGLLELYDFKASDPIGYLTAEQVKYTLKRRLIYELNSEKH